MVGGARLSTFHEAHRERQGGAVLACSALKQAYRDVLVRHVAGARVVYLDLPRTVVEERLQGRRGQHEFVGEFAHLLDGQYRDLEPPKDAITLNAQLPPAEIVERAAALLLAPH